MPPKLGEPGFTRLLGQAYNKGFDTCVNGHDLLVAENVKHYKDGRRTCLACKRNLGSTWKVGYRRNPDSPFARKMAKARAKRKLNAGTAEETVKASNSGDALPTPNGVPG
jgi:hypothetical protein